MIALKKAYPDLVTVFSSKNHWYQKSNWNTRKKSRGSNGWGIWNFHSIIFNNEAEKSYQVAEKPRLLVCIDPSWLNFLENEVPPRKKVWSHFCFCWGPVDVVNSCTTFAFFSRGYVDITHTWTNTVPETTRPLKFMVVETEMFALFLLFVFFLPKKRRFFLQTVVLMISPQQILARPGWVGVTATNFSWAVTKTDLGYFAVFRG